VRIDHGLFRVPTGTLPTGQHQLAVITREETGREGVRRVAVTVP
jgi:hypothetical protein